MRITRGLFRLLVASVLWVLCLFIGSVAHAGNDPQLAATEGAGDERCSSVNAHYAANPEKAELVYGNWLSGYLTGLNSAAGMFVKNQIHDLQAWSIKSQTRRLRDYCSDHPRNLYFEGAFELWTALPVAPKAIPPLIWGNK